VVTFVLVLVVVAVATDSRVPRGIAAMAIGAALAVAIVISGPVSGAGVNPARAIGPMILAGQFTDWWAYLTAPLAGGVAAVALYDRFPAGRQHARLAITPADDDPVPAPGRPEDHYPDPDWRQLAACRHADPELFFPVSASGPSLDQVTQAKAICAGCPVRRYCLAFALHTRQDHGI
jgi:Transcription factor WhiB/Major intrinsic protein